ncbi:MAG: ankyrin repeat domain-containing protein [Gammaproteobacteria bacterium]
MLGNIVTIEDYWGENQQHWCAQSNMNQKAEEYLAINIRPKQNHHGIHPLHCLAFCTGNIDYAKWLLKVSVSASLIMPDILGRTPLHFAANRAHLDFMKEFINSNNVNIEDLHGRTPLIACCLGSLGTDQREYRIGVLKLLLSLGANVEHKDAAGYDAYDYASHFFPYLLEYFEQQKEILLVKPSDFFGANSITRRFLNEKFSEISNDIKKFDIRDGLGFSALHMLCFSEPETKKSNQVLFELLEHLFISPDEQSLLEIMPAHIAASLGKSEFFSKLLMRMPIVNYADIKGRTFVIAACIPTGHQDQRINERVKIIHELEKRNADFLFKDHYNRSALDYANMFFPGSILVKEVVRITVIQTKGYLVALKNSSLPKHFIPGFEKHSIGGGENKHTVTELSPPKNIVKLSPRG